MLSELAPSPRPSNHEGTKKAGARREISFLFSLGFSGLGIPCDQVAIWLHDKPVDYAIIPQHHHPNYPLPRGFVGLWQDDYNVLTSSGPRWGSGTSGTCPRSW